MAEKIKKLCPNCLREISISYEEDTVKCEHCGYTMNLKLQLQTKIISELIEFAFEESRRKWWKFWWIVDFPRISYEWGMTMEQVKENLINWGMKPKTHPLGRIPLRTWLRIFFPHKILILKNFEEAIKGEIFEVDKEYKRILYFGDVSNELWEKFLIILGFSDNNQLASAYLIYIPRYKFFKDLPHNEKMFLKFFHILKEQYGDPIDFLDEEFKFITSPILPSQNPEIDHIILLWITEGGKIFLEFHKALEKAPLVKLCYYSSFFKESWDFVSSVDYYYREQISIKLEEYYR